jgi:heptosyltransferase-3
MDFKGVRKILVIKLRHIGDVLLTVPVFRALREHFGDARISALVNSGTQDVLEGNPLIDEILLFERAIKGLSPAKRSQLEIAFLKGLREKRFDMTVDLTGGDRPAILSFASGARYRLGWRPKKGFFGKRLLYTHLSDPEGKAHMVLQNLHVVSRFGICTNDLSVDFHIPDTDRDQVKRILTENKVTNHTTVAHIHPTSRWLFKCWNDEFMAGIITWLLDRNITVVVTSSTETREMKKAKKILSLAGESPGLIDLCGKTTIKQLGAVSEAADLFFGVDSAPMHIAAAVGTPVVALFGPSGAFNWGPWDNKSSGSDIQGSACKSPYAKRNGIQTFGIHTVIQRDWDCVPCGSDGCGGSKISRCLEEISAEEVRSVIAERLGKRKS